VIIAGSGVRGTEQTRLFLLLPAEFAAQPEAEDEDGEEEDAEGGAEGLVVGPGELVLDDFADGGIGPAAHQVGDGEHGDGLEKDASNGGRFPLSGPNRPIETMSTKNAQKILDGLM